MFDPSGAGESERNEEVTVRKHLSIGEQGKDEEVAAPKTYVWPWGRERARKRTEDVTVSKTFDQKKGRAMDKRLPSLAIRDHDEQSGEREVTVPDSWSQKAERREGT